MTPQEKTKEIAVAFAAFFAGLVVKHPEDAYAYWIGTEEGKRLTAEDRSEPEEPAINILIKISKQLNRIEGRMDKMNGNLFAG
jgi:hypothetical protein